MDEWIHEDMHAWMNGFRDTCMHGLIKLGMHACMDEWI